MNLDRPFSDNIDDSINKAIGCEEGLNSVLEIEILREMLKCVVADSHNMNPRKDSSTGATYIAAMQHYRQRAKANIHSKRSLGGVKTNLRIIPGGSKSDRVIAELELPPV